MNTLLKLSDTCAGRILLHLSCLARCFALNVPSKRARASFHWCGVKRELQLGVRSLPGFLARASNTRLNGTQPKAPYSNRKTF